MVAKIGALELKLSSSPHPTLAGFHCQNILVTISFSMILVVFLFSLELFLCTLHYYHALYTRHMEHSKRHGAHCPLLTRLVSL